MEATVPDYRIENQPQSNVNIEEGVDDNGNNEENNSTNLALQGKWDSINIGVGVIAALGNPSHICLLRNMKEKSLAVIACDGKDNMSIRVPDGFLDLHKSFKIHSKQFVYETLTGWGLDSEKTYSFKGEYLEEQKMVVFSLKSEDL